MTTEELAIYLKDICNLEPRPLPTPLGTKIKLIETVEDEDPNPIKIKVTKKGKKPAFDLKKAEAAFL